MSNDLYSNLNIAVIGDIMLDHWRETTEHKLNPEAPTIDLTNPTSEYTLGGAGNVARIIKELGVRVQLFGVLGEFTPYANTQLCKMCDKLDIGWYMQYEQRRTTVKERIICDGQQVCRISEEDTYPISVDTANKLVRSLECCDGVRIDKLDGIIVSDYSKGVMRDMLIHAVHHIAKKNNIPVLVDPKDRLDIYKGYTIVKLNDKEWDNLSDSNESDIGFFERMEIDHLVMTSKKGINWYTDDMKKGFVCSHDVEIANVSGAGDVVAAVLLLEYIRDGVNHLQVKSIENAVKLANWGASKVVQQKHTGHLTVDDLLDTARPFPIARIDTEGNEHVG